MKNGIASAENLFIMTSCEQNNKKPMTNIYGIGGWEVRVKGQLTPIL